MPNATPALPVEAPLPDRVIALSDGAANAPEGAWPDRIHKRITRAEMSVFLAPAPARARALVYGGGGYIHLVHDKEGVEVALWLNAQSIDAYVLTHRMPGQADADGGVWPYDIALTDGLKALDYLASLAPLPLLHVGLSSGGHLAGVMACQDHSQKAKGALIAYAPINANHRDYKAPAGKPDYPPAEKQAFYDAWPIGITAEPHGIPRMPIFLAYALHDQVVPVDHALNLIKALQQTGSEVDAHIFPQAPHGFALRELDGTHDQWPSLAARWIDKVLVG